MKIRTKIIWISCIAVFAASIIGDVIIMILAKNSFMEEALVQAFHNSYEIVADIVSQDNLNMSQDTLDKYYEYYFKSKGDDYNICLRVGENVNSEMNCIEIFNHTIIDKKILLDLQFKNYDNTEIIQYSYLDIGEEHYVIFKSMIESQYLYYRIENISYVQSKSEILTVCLFVITLVLTAFTSSIMFLVLKRVFKPLQELNETTKQMAKGLYNKRIKIISHDEVGQLGESFNKMAEAVEIRTHSLEESEKKKTLFMGNLTHELKTPMTAISGYAQTLLSTKLSKEQQEESLIYIYEQCGRLERLSKKMIKLLELDNGEGIELIDTPIADIFEAVKKSCTAVLREKEVALELQHNDGIFPMDSDLMTDALINLTENAVKASKTGDKVILKSYGSFIEVQDFGQGIPDDEIDKILEPFYMIDKSRSRKSGGAGLGLALTALIVKKHNMTLTVKSEIGKGTKMILQFV